MKVVQTKHTWVDYYFIAIAGLLIHLIINYSINELGGLNYLSNFKQSFEIICMSLLITLFGLLLSITTGAISKIYLIPFFIQLPIFYFYNFFWSIAFIGSLKSYNLTLNGIENQNTKLLLFIIFWLMIIILRIVIIKKISVDYKKIIITNFIVMFLYNPILKLIFYLI